MPSFSECNMEDEITDIDLYDLNPYEMRLLRLAFSNREWSDDDFKFAETVTGMLELKVVPEPATSLIKWLHETRRVLSIDELEDMLFDNDEWDDLLEGAE